MPPSTKKSPDIKFNSCSFILSSSGGKKKKCHFMSRYNVTCYGSKYVNLFQ